MILLNFSCLMIYIINKTFKGNLQSSHPSRNLWPDLCPKLVVISPPFAFHLNGTPFQHGRELRGTPLESVAVFNRKRSCLRMDESMKSDWAMFWKDIWRRSKSDSAIVIVCYNSVLFVYCNPGRPLQVLGALYSVTSLHVKFLFSESFQWNPLISQHEALQQRLKAAGIIARCLWAKFWRGPGAGFTVYTWLKFYMLCYPFCESSGFFVARFVDASFWSSDRAAGAPCADCNLPSEKNIVQSECVRGDQILPEAIQV